MTNDTGCDYLTEDKQLRVGKMVKAFWCKNGFYYQGDGVIVELTRDQVSVELKNHVAWSDEYTRGKTVRLPRISDKTHWSTRNCVRPLTKFSMAS